MPINFFEIYLLEIVGTLCFWQGHKRLMSKQLVASQIWRTKWVLWDLRRRLKNKHHASYTKKTTTKYLLVRLVRM
jgi:hypothetical protein